MNQVITFLVIVLLAMLSTILAHRIKVAYPIVLVAAGALIGSLPFVPTIALPPDMVFLVFLPPLLYNEAISAPVREYRRNTWTILRLAVGLVLATIVATALMYRAFRPEIDIALAVVLGAIVSPTDELATSIIAHANRLPRRISALLEGESLFNDVIALVVFSTALQVIVARHVSFLFITSRLAYASLVGIVLGIAVSKVALLIRRMTRDPAIGNVISLLTAYAAYVPADALGASGVLSVVTCGLLLGRQGPRAVSPRTRMQNRELYAVLLYLMNSVLFFMVGLQLRPITGLIGRAGLIRAIELGICTMLVCFAMRAAWMFIAHFLRRRDPLSLGEATVLSWSGLRGAVSLAAALALPQSLAGRPFPFRAEMVVATYTVILLGLVLQGLTLGPLIRRLDLPGDNDDEEYSVARLRLGAAVDRALAAERDADPNVLSRVADLVRRDESYTDLRVHQMRKRILRAERAELLLAWESNQFDDSVMRTLQREIDLREIAAEET